MNTDNYLTSLGGINVGAANANGDGIDYVIWLINR